jgi:putative endonuclease
MADRRYYVYILTTKNNTVLYTGITNDISRRIEEHKAHLASKFTRRYNVDKLVYAEVCEDASTAISREKQIKGGSRAKKIALVESQNPDWRDLSYSI